MRNDTYSYMHRRVITFYQTSVIRPHLETVGQDCFLIYDIAFIYGVLAITTDAIDSSFVKP